MQERPVYYSDWPEWVALFGVAVFGALGFVLVTQNAWGLRMLELLLPR